MPRRRYRLFMVCAVVMVFMLYRVSQNSDWDPSAYTGLTRPINHGHSHDHDHASHAETEPKTRPLSGDDDDESTRPPAYHEEHDHDHGHDGHDDHAPPKDAAPVKEYTVKLPELKTSLEHPGTYGLPTKLPKATKAADAADAAAPATTAAPDATKAKGESQDVHWKNPPAAAKEHPPKPVSTHSQIHWRKMPEHFPIDEETLITLPDGKPKAIPKVQFAFGEEPEAAREKRVKRQAQVKEEMQRAWSGYRKYAWMHDELSPVSKKFRDPFCGWAASLVDGLDTLWLMGMVDEFGEAARAVADIDFTYSLVRKDIPVFETIIRYLGGLIAAHDVSATATGKSKYPMLLEKAQELAEILMGIFDTPNRLPILYYNWLPEYASQPHRATTVSVAEFGSMSMEFTRLAQLTGKQKYYDAIARITNALEDLQERGTTLDGIFPEQLDASGCNRTAQAEQRAERERMSREADRQAAEILSRWSITEPQGYQPTSAPVAEKPEPAPPKARSPDAEAGSGSAAAGRNAESAVETREDKAGGVEKRQVREEEDGKVVSESIPRQVPGSPEEFPENPNATANPWAGPWNPYGDESEWDCPPQGLQPAGSGFETYSMGGSQDSTYEYFPKVSCRIPWHRARKTSTC